MFGFPVNLQDRNVQKFTNDADNGFPKIQQREIFYSVRDGNWNDRTMWQTASGRVGLFPTRNDDVYVRHFVNVNSNITNGGFSCFNLFVTGYLNTDLGTSYAALSIFGNLKCTGTLNLGPTNSTGDPFYIYLSGKENVIDNYILGNTYISYVGNDQPIIPMTYNYVSTQFTNYLIGNIVVNTRLVTGSSSIFDFRNYDIVSNGIFQTGNYSLVIKTGGSNNSVFNSIILGSLAGLDFRQSNPNIEIKGGISCGNNSAIFTGTGTWTFTTNNQSINLGVDSVIGWDCTTIISGAINVSNIGGAPLTISNTINGTTGSSKLTNHATIVFTTLASVASMTTGIVDFTTFANTIQYGGNYTATIPSYFSTFHNLTISGTGTKSLGVNTTLNGNLTLNGPISSVSHGILECGNYNLSVTGTTIFQCGGLIKSGSGNLLFIGNFLSQFGYNTNRLSFTGNPNVEFRGGINRGNYDWNGGWNTGTGDWTFTTNNQTFQGPNAYGANSTCRFIVTGNITITYTLGETHSFANKIDGTTASSTWINQGVMNFNGTEFTPMTTGIFDYLTSATSTLAYYMNSNITLPYTTYSNLTIASPNGIFYNIPNNTTINNSLFISTRSELRCSTFNLSVLGTTTSYGTLSKTGSGNILFVGLFTAPNGGVFKFIFTGNPNVEFKNGIITNPGSNGSFDPSTIFGTGTYSFTTNNQTINISAQIGNTNFNPSILISGAIVATFQSLNNIYFSATINGNNAGSTLRMAASTTLDYRSATQPMATGILDTSTNLNTWIYGNANQDIKGLPTTSPKQVYRNLTLNGGGVKTLQGFVSVLNTYTLTAPATLANNGFTLTNP